jgi:hypothetical protein
MTNRQDIQIRKDCGTLYEMCSCGHFGGMSPNNMHNDHFQQGHGSCNDCECIKFTWVSFCDEKGDELK